MSATGLRLGLMSHASGVGAPRQIVAETIELAVEAERLGFDSFWVAQHHLGSEQSVVASPLVLLAAVAARTARIDLGTAVVILPLEDPRRLAEDVDQVELISDGRLQLGLGSGTSPDTFGVFGADHSVRRETFAAHADRLEGYLSSPEPGLVSQPGRSAGKLWTAVSTPDAAARARARGHGVMLGRFSPGGGDVGVTQHPLVQAYDAVPHVSERRVAVTRSIWPAATSSAGLAEIEAGARAWARHFDVALAAEPVSAIADRLAARTGTAEALSRVLQADPTVAVATDLLVQFQPGLPSFDRQREALRTIAHEIAPTLGWSPVREDALTV